MKKILLLTVAATLCFAEAAFSFGKEGHDAVAYIAECHLTAKAKKNIARYTDGRSIVYYASWMDAHRKDAEYLMTDKWHGGNVGEDLKYSDQSRKMEGDCTYEVQRILSEMRNGGYRKLSDSTVLVNIKYLTHLLGDMHCPSHIKYPKGTVPTVKYLFRGDKNGKATTQKMGYHGIWDSEVIRSNNRWGYMEWQHQLDHLSKKQIAAIQDGTPADWFSQSAQNCKCIYTEVKTGDVYNKDFYNKYRTLVEDQILKAGYRLAEVLNEIFG